MARKKQGDTQSAKAEKRQYVKPEPSVFRWFFGHVFSVLRRHGSMIGFWVGMGYLANKTSQTLMAFAGRQSQADLEFRVLTSVSLTFTASIVLSGLSVSLYLRERAQHRETRRRLSARNTELELLIDPTRTSSKLTQDGLTRREDM